MGIRTGRRAGDYIDKARLLLVEEKCQYQRKGFESSATQGVVPWPAALV